MSGYPSIGSILGNALAQEAQPDGPLLRAARGELFALRQLVQQHIQAAIQSTSHATRLGELGQALSFCRLSVAFGEKQDQHRLVGLYGEIAGVCRAAGDQGAADTFEAQGLLFAEDLARLGDEVMEDGIASAADAISPGALVIASKIRGGEA